MAKAPRLPANFEKNVFINCPFDVDYQPLFYGIVFAVSDMGFRPRCAKDESNAGKGRIEKIQGLKGRSVSVRSAPTARGSFA